MLNEARLYEVLEEVLVKVAELVLGKDVAEVVLVVDDVVESVISLLISMGAFVFTSGLFVAAGGWVLTVTGVG